MSNNAQLKTLIQSRVSLAPMAGITDYVLRSLVRKYSKTALLTTEMISSEALNNVRETDITMMDDTHHPISYQLSGHKPHLMQKAGIYLAQRADMIDINMGCPVKKVVGGNDGCSLMRTPQLAADLVKAIKEGIDKPVSVKFRLGFTLDELNYVEFGQAMQEAGADFITIHGRTRSQMYSGKADHALVKKLKENVDVPVFTNGDITSIDDAIEALELSGADGVAIGRGIIGDPTLIHRIEHYLATGEKIEPPSIEEKIEILKEHLRMEVELRGENIGVKFMRKFYPYYIAGVKNASKLRGALVVEDSYAKILETLNTLPINI